MTLPACQQSQRTTPRRKMTHARMATGQTCSHFDQLQLQKWLQARRVVISTSLQLPS
jgi:hypothetical protein